MPAPVLFFISLGMAVFFLASSPVQAQDFVLPADLQASWCSTSWSVSGSTYTCTGGSGKITFPSDAIISSSNAVVFVANAGFELNNARLGNESSRVSLRAPNGGALVRSAVGAEVSGFIETSGTVDLAGTKVGEYIKSNGKVTLVGGGVAGNVESINSGVSATGGAVFGGEIKANGDVNLVGGSVEKRVTSTNNKVITQGASLLGGATAHSGMSIKGSGDTIIKGDFIFTSLNAAYFEGVKMISGSSIGTAGTAYFKDSVIGTLTNPVDVRVNGSATVKLENSTIYGMVHVPDYGQWSPLITGDSRSHIYGECLRFSGGARPLSDPARLCDGSAVPPDPVDPAECKVELHVEHMIAGLQNQGRVVVVDEPGCEKPDSLDFIFGYVSPEDPPEKASLVLNGVDLLDPNKPKVSLDFSGGNEALLIVEYNEAGRLWLKIDAENQVRKEFVSRPYGLCLETDLNHAEDLLFQRKNGGEPIHSAGDIFELRILAVAWRDDAKGLNDVREADTICNNPPILNYRQYFDEETGERSIGLEPILIEPDLEGGALEVALGRTAHDHTDAGQMTLPDQSISEVGIFMIKAIPPEYLGADMTHAISLSSRIGRFVPAYLAIEKSIDLEPSCSKAEYSYQGQPIFFNESARLHVIGKNRQGETTLNYDRGEFWQFGGLSKHKMFSATDIDALDRKVRDGDIECQAADYRNCWAKRLADDSSLAALTDDVVGDGQRSYSLNGSVTYLRRAIELDKYDAPFEAAVRLFIDREDLSDQDDVTHSLDGESLSADYLSEPIQGSQVRLGRVRAENVIASDIPAPPRANLPLWLEQWDGNFFNPEDDQGCTTFESNPVESDYKGNLKMVDVDRQFSAEKEKQQEGVGIQAITGTENRFDGSALIEHIIKGPAGTAPLWLCQSHESGLGGICSYYKSEDISRAMAQVTFGIYQGPKPLIFRRELYRGMQ